MNRSLTQLAIVTLFILLGSGARSEVGRSQGSLTFQQVLLSDEARLASGARVSFRDADQYLLELIPGVSEGIARALLAARSEILEYSIRQAKKSPYEAAYGVGPKRAILLTRYLRLPGEYGELTVRSRPLVSSR